MEYSPTGALAIAFGSSKHWAILASADFSSVSQRVDLTNDADADWTTSGRPIAVEMFEKLYIADATKAFADRHEFVTVTSAGVLNVPKYDFIDDTTQLTIKPYTIEEFKSVLFLAGGLDSGDVEDSAILWHSMLALDPDTEDADATAAGIHLDNWAIIGAKNVEITALKAGRDAMLVGKRNKLFRITGDPIAEGGWQFAIEGVDSNTGFGPSNAYALTYANGWWYGIGDAGPFRTNGFDVVDAIVTLRQDSWDEFVGDIDLAWVVPHPSRQLILFGIPGASSADPQIVWVWDTVRERWFGDWDFGVTLKHIAPIVNRSATPGPGATAPIVVIGTETETGIPITVTLGDSSASTEIWIRERSDEGMGIDGTWYLTKVLGVGTTTFTIVDKGKAGQTAITVDGYRHFEVRARHNKQDITGDYSATVDAFTLLPDPTIRRLQTVPSGVQFRVTQLARGADLEVSWQTTDIDCGTPGGYGSARTISAVTGEEVVEILNTDTDIALVCDTSVQVRARAIDSGYSGTTTSSFEESGDTEGLVCTGACTFIPL